MTKLSDYTSIAQAQVDLDSLPTVVQVTITNTAGADAVILDATAARAGVMTQAQASKLNGIADEANKYIHPSYTQRVESIDTGPLSGAKVVSDVDLNLSSNSLGHVISCDFQIATRDLTLSDIGFSGDANANFYSHPAYTPRVSDVDSGALTGATVISDIDMSLVADSFGHVTESNMAINTRQLTPADIGAAALADVPPLNAGVCNLGVTGVNATGTVVWVSIGNLVMVTGTLSWSTGGVGSTPVSVTNFPFTNTYATGCALGTNNVKNPDSQRMGIRGRMVAGANYLEVWRMQGQSANVRIDADKLEANGSIDINFSYYAAELTA